MSAYDDLRPASFGGVGFHVREDEASGGRRVVVHRFAGGETPLTEDFGGADQTFLVDCYCAGDASGPEARALSALFQSGGIKPLALPLGDFAAVRLLSWRRSRSLDRIGYVGFRAEFLSVSGVAGVSLSPATIVAAARNLGAGFAAAFSGAFS